LVVRESIYPTGNHWQSKRTKWDVCILSLSIFHANNGISTLSSQNPTPTQEVFIMPPVTGHTLHPESWNVLKKLLVKWGKEEPHPQLLLGI
jgi:hypothetical protein